MLDISVTTSELVAIADPLESPLSVVDPYHICLRQLRSTRTYFAGHISTLLASHPVPPRSLVNDIYWHIEVVMDRPNAGDSITFNAVGQDAKAVNEHNNIGYSLTGEVNALRGHMQALKSICTDVLASYDSGGSATNGDKVAIQAQITLILSRYP